MLHVYIDYVSYLDKILNIDMFWMKNVYTQF